jgi:hypothetical protein
MAQGRIQHGGDILEGVDLTSLVTFTASSPRVGISSAGLLSVVQGTGDASFSVGVVTPVSGTGLTTKRLQATISEQAVRQRLLTSMRSHQYFCAQVGMQDFDIAGSAFVRNQGLATSLASFRVDLSNVCAHRSAPLLCIQWLGQVTICNLLRLSQTAPHRTTPASRPL